MKLELPLALGLLAFGCWLFIPGRVWQHSEQKTESKAPAPTRISVAQATFQQQAVSEAENAGSRERQPEKPVSPPASSRPANSIEARRLVKNAARMINEGPPVQSKSRLKINLFDQSLLLEGEYLHAGQNRGKTRFDFEVTTVASRIHITQICDGETLLLQKDRDGKKEISHANLAIVAGATSPEIPFAGSPANRLGMGGVGSLLQQLESSFDFDPPQPQMLGGITTWKITGSWKPGRLRQILQNYVDPKWIGPEIDWEKLPPQIPHTVEINLGNDQFLPLFPYRIVFSRYQVSDAESKLVPTVTIEMYEVNKRDYLDDGNFRLETTGQTSVNITSRFSDRLEQFKQIQANQQAVSPDLSQK